MRRLSDWSFFVFFKSSFWAGVNYLTVTGSTEQRPPCRDDRSNCCRYLRETHWSCFFDAQPKIHAYAPPPKPPHPHPPQLLLTHLKTTLNRKAHILFVCDPVPAFTMAPYRQHETSQYTVCGKNRSSLTKGKPCRFYWNAPHIWPLQCFIVQPNHEISK